ncbi:MAG TPA: CHAT domain-containing protein, partial [Blastocatellia bacterium]|nr:CHAT domain-containing protein [Blastocatellia bacterium]
GFMYAGAPRVMASLWKVDDEPTAKLMRYFYEHLLKEKMSPAAALRAAQLTLSQDAEWSAPYHWGSFVLQGEWK